MAFEQFTNDPSTTLNGGINDSVTSLVVNDGSLFPTTGNFRILINSEILLVTSISTNTLTVVRAQEGTSAAAHSDTDDVILIVTAESVKNVMQDYYPFVGNTAELVPQNVLLDSSGNLLTDASFTWTNQGASTTEDLDNGNIRVQFPLTTGSNVRVFTRSAPSTPYVITASIAGTINNDADGHMGMVFRESSSGELYTFALYGNRTIRILKYTNPTTFSADLFAAAEWHVNENANWMRLEDDGTDLNFYYSPNGIQWHLVATEGRTVLMAGGPDEVGVYGNSNSTGISMGMILTHWSGE
jgi:hypothetical protein